MEWDECTPDDDTATAVDREKRRLDDAERTIDCTWSVAGPYDAQLVFLAAVGIDKLTRYLAHATLPGRTQETGASKQELYRLISALRSGISRLDQVLTQIRDHAQDSIPASDDRGGTAAAPRAETAELMRNLDSAAERIRDVAATMAEAQRTAAHIHIAAGVRRAQR